jgi:hypothetical protein
MARPGKFTPEACDRFLKALQMGAKPEVAATFAGWSPRTYYRIMRGRSPGHAAFRADMERIENELELRVVGTLLKAAFSDPRWAVDFLERRFPERWRKQRPDWPEESGAAAAAATPGPDEVVLDPALVDEIVPRLLEAGRQERGDPPGAPAESFEMPPPGLPAGPESPR